MAIKHHPDRGGDSEKFKEVNGAYEILKDEEKKKIYDQYGMEGLKGFAQRGEGGFGDIFDMFFSNRGGSRKRQK